MRFYRPLSKILFVGCILGATLSAAFAQDGARQGRGGGGGQGGGRGGMRMGGMGGGGGLASLVRMEEVRKELKVDEEQTKELTTAQDEMVAEMRSMFQGAGGGGPPSPEDMQKNMEKMRDLQVKLDAKLEEILDPKQMDRLLGLLIQRDGVRSVSTTILATRLKITEDQKTKMSEVEKAAGETMRSLFSGGAGGGRPGPEVMEKMTAMRKESEEKLQAILTAEQKSTMESMKGEKFEFPAPNFGPPGGGGRGGNRNPGA